MASIETIKKKDKPGRYDSIFRRARLQGLDNPWLPYVELSVINEWDDTSSLLISSDPVEHQRGMDQWYQEWNNKSKWIDDKVAEKNAAKRALKAAEDEELASKGGTAIKITPDTSDYAQKINEEQPQKKEDKVEIDKYGEEESEANITENKIQDEAKSTTFSLSVAESDDMVNRWCSYLVLWKEWFFDLHKMVKGTIILYGIDNYITVGTNILIPSKVLTSSKNFNYQDKFLENTYLLAHVESVKNSFSVSGGGARTYTTTIDFSRGIIVDAMSEISGYLKDGTYMLDDILKDPPGDRDFDNKVNVNTTTDSKIEGGTISKIAKVFNKKDGNEEEA